MAAFDTAGPGSSGRLRNPGTGCIPEPDCHCGSQPGARPVPKPDYITKKEAQKLGWDNKKGNLWEVAPGKSIGGSHFGNYEKLLPEKKGRKYYECDINYEGEYRGAERIIYSDDGLIFYTGDHYKTFEQLYPQAANQ